METQNLLYKKEVQINDDIKIIIPTVGQILENEDSYYTMVTTLTSMPIDLMVQLDDMGIDFSQIDEYDLFLLLFGSLKSMDTSLVFGELDLSDFELCVNQENGMVVLRDETNDITIDKAIHDMIARTLRLINNIEKNNRKPGNDDAKKYMIERARAKQRRSKNKKEVSQTESQIVALVNTEQFKYNFNEVLDLTIYQFNESVKQVVKKINYDNLMHGVYVGMIDSKNLNPDDLNWLSNK